MRTLHKILRWFACDFWFPLVQSFVICLNVVELLFIYIKICHETKLQTFVTIQSFKRVLFWNVNPARARIISPNPTFILKPSLGPETKFTEWVKICATTGDRWRSKVNIINNSVIFYWRFNQLVWFNSNWWQVSVVEKKLYAAEPSPESLQLGALTLKI